MKQFFLAALTALLCYGSAQAQTTNHAKPQLFLDVHYLPGAVKFEDVAAAHAKDLAVQSKYGVQFFKYWVDESKGVVYCLSSATDTASIRKTHAEAHGLLPNESYAVTEGIAAAPKAGKAYFMDVHRLGAGNVTATAVASAHEKDLATQTRHGVHFVNYWVDTQQGVIFCLSQADDAGKVVQTHKEAHGLLPASIAAVKQGQ